MKVRHIWLVAAVAFLTFGFSCNNQKNFIAKDWKVTDIQMDADFSGSKQHQEIFKRFRENADLNFNADGTYSFDLVTEKQKGTWEINKKQKLLITTSDAGVITENKIVELSENKLVIKNEKEDIPVTMVLVPKE